MEHEKTDSDVRVGDHSPDWMDGFDQGFRAGKIAAMHNYSMILSGMFLGFALYAMIHYAGK